MSVFTPAERKVILNYIYSINVSSGAPVSSSDLRLRFPTLMARRNADGGLDSLSGLSRLPDGSYVRKNRKALGKLWGAIDYESKHSLQSGSAAQLVRNRDFISDTLDSIDKTPLEGDELFEVAGKYGDIQNIILHLIGQAKEDLMSDKEFSLNMVVTDSVINKNPDIKAKIKDSLQRTEAIELVLRFLNSTGLVWMGRFTNEKIGGDLDYFYLDVGIFSETSFSLLERIKSSSAWKNHDKATVQIADQLENFYQTKLKEYFEDKFADFNSKFQKINEELSRLGTHVQAGKHEEELHQNFLKYRDNMTTVVLSFEREKRTFFFGKETFDLLNLCQQQESDLLARFENLPFEIEESVKKMITNGDIINIRDDSHEMFGLLDKNMRYRESSKRRMVLLHQTQKYFEKGFETFLTRKGLRMEKAPGKMGREDTLIYNKEFYIHHNIEENTFFIYDIHNTIEIDLRNKMGNMLSYRKYEESFKLLEKALFSYLKSQQVFSMLKKQV